MLVLTLLVLLTAGSARSVADGSRSDSSAAAPQTYGQTYGPAGRTVTAKKEKRPKLEVPESFYLVPADKQKGRDLESAQGHLAIGETELGENDEEDEEPGTLTADVGDLAGKVRIVVGTNGCELDSRTKVTCPMFSGDDASPPDFDLRALAAGRAGDTGTIRYTYTSPGGQVVEESTRAQIGRPLLGVRQLPVQRRTEQGDTVELPLVFKNMGEVTARGIVVSFNGKVEPSPAKRHRNCRYKAKHAVTTCTFPDTRLRPGEARTLKPAPSAQRWGSEMYQRFDYRVAPLDDPDFSGTPGGPEPEGGEPGRGSTVRLVKTSEEGGRFYTGKDKRQDMYLLAQRDSHVDYEAIGARVSAPAGDTVRVRVGVRNRGPAAFGVDGIMDGRWAKVKVTLPPGTDVVRAPRELIDTETYSPLCKRKGRTYTCALDPPDRGQTDKSLEFLLRINKSGTGKVEVPDEPLPRRDPDPADDTAAITLEAEPASWITWTLLGLSSAAAVAALVWTRRRWTGPLRRTVRRQGRERTG